MLPETLFSLAGRTALVTGSSRGIGRVLARTLGLAGAQVIFHASRPSGKLDEALGEARADGIRCLSVTADLSDPSSIEPMMAQIPSPDILVLNASTQQYMHIEDFDADEFTREFHTNVLSSTLLIKAVLPAMTAAGFGRVIAIGSVNQWKPAPRLAAYASSKTAQETIIACCAKTYANRGITFNNVAPGIITTDRNAQTLADPAMAEQLIRLVPAGRFGKPEDVAGIVLCLASEAGAYITGANIPCTGGMHL